MISACSTGSMALIPRTALAYRTVLRVPRRPLLTAQEYIGWVQGKLLTRIQGRTPSDFARQQNSLPVRPWKSRCRAHTGGKPIQPLHRTISLFGPCDTWRCTKAEAPKAPTIVAVAVFGRCCPQASLQPLSTTVWWSLLRKKLVHDKPFQHRKRVPEMQKQ